MGYLQDSLINALGMQKVYKQDRSAVISDWTPNGIKAIIITADYILVAKHLGVSVGCVKSYPLDRGMVIEDLMNISRSNNGKPKLNTVLMKRSLTCLEEIYVDGLYMSYPSVINLVDYVQEMMKSSTRLRYFGYGSLPESGLDAYLNKAYMDNSRNLDYAIGTDDNISKVLNVRAVDNEKWYTKYMLRPTYYKLDSDKGNLAIHFRKFEDNYSKFESAIGEKAKDDTLNEMLRAIVETDKAEYENIKRIDLMLYKIEMNKTPLSKKVLGIWKDVILSRSSVNGLSKEVLEKAVGKLDESLFKSYFNYRVLDTKSGSIDMGTLSKYSKGFIDAESVLDDFCLCLCSELLRMGNKELVGVSLEMNADDIPKGKLKDKYLPNVQSDGSFHGYLHLISDLLGYIV